MCVSPKAKRFGVGFRYRSTQPTITKSLRMWAIAFRRHTHRQDATLTGKMPVPQESIKFLAPQCKDLEPSAISLHLRSTEAFKKTCC